MLSPRRGCRAALVRHRCSSTRADDCDRIHPLIAGAAANRLSATRVQRDISSPRPSRRSASAASSTRRRRRVYQHHQQNWQPALAEPLQSDGRVALARVALGEQVAFEDGPIGELAAATPRGAIARDAALAPAGGAALFPGYAFSFCLTNTSVNCSGARTPKIELVACRADLARARELAPRLAGRPILRISRQPAG